MRPLKKGKQCKYYGISRGKYYHKPKVKEDLFVDLKDRIRDKYILGPSLGSRRITTALNRDGISLYNGIKWFIEYDTSDLIFKKSLRKEKNYLIN